MIRIWTTPCLNCIRERRQGPSPEVPDEPTGTASAGVGTQQMSGGEGSAGGESPLAVRAHVQSAGFRLSARSALRNFMVAAASTLRPSAASTTPYSVRAALAEM